MALAEGKSPEEAAFAAAVANEELKEDGIEILEAGVLVTVEEEWV